TASSVRALRVSRRMSARARPYPPTPREMCAPRRSCMRGLPDETSAIDRHLWRNDQGCFGDGFSVCRLLGWQCDLTANVPPMCVTALCDITSCRFAATLPSLRCRGSIHARASTQSTVQRNAVFAQIAASTRAHAAARASLLVFDDDIATCDCDHVI